MIFNQLDIFSVLDAEEKINPNIVTPSDSRWKTTLEYFSKTQIFGFDLETYGKEEKDALNYFKGFIRIISVGLDNGLCLLIDLGGWNKEVRNEEISNFFSILKIQLFNKEVIKCGHNLKFDIGYMLSKYGYHTRNVRDTMLMSQLLWSGLGVDKAKIGENRSQRCKISHSLKGVAERLGIEVDKTEQKSNWGWDLTNKQLNYAANDSLVVIEIYNRLKALLIEENLLYSAYVECLACPAFAEIEYAGFCVDDQELDKAIQLYKKAQLESLLPWKEEFPYVNWASPSQVSTALNEKYKMHLEKADDAALQDLPYSSVKGLLDARSLGISLKYLESIKQNMFDGSVRSSYSQIAAAGTGRSASRNINLQNPAKLLPEHEAIGLPSVRSVFKAPAGYKLIVADLSAAHSRIAAHMSKDKTLSKAYNKGIDNHLVMTAKLLELDNSSISEKEVFEIYKQKSHSLYKKIKNVRDKAKISFYSFLNQAGKVRVQQAFRSFRIEVSVEDCETLIKLLRKTYNGLYKYILKRIEEANQFNHNFSHFFDSSGKPLVGYYGEIRGLTGRRQYCKKSKSNYDPSKKEIAFTDSIAFMWLSSEADMLKHAMGLLLLEFDNHPEWEARYLNMCHDELDILCKEEYAEEVANLVGTTIKTCLSRWITSIPVEETDLDYKSFIADNWSEK